MDDELGDEGFDLGAARFFVGDGKVSVCYGLCDFTFDAAAVVNAHFVNNSLYLEACNFNIQLRCTLEEAKAFAMMTGIAVNISTFKTGLGR